MRKINKYTWSTGAASGGDGSATATAYSPHLNGRVLKVYVAYNGDKPATTVFTLSDESDPASEAIARLANNVTNTTLCPRRAIQDNAGNDVTFDGTNEIYVPFVVDGRLEATVAQTNDDDYVEVTVWMEAT